MTMEEWIEAGSQPGPYWVYDVDGWAYWAQAIEPDTATGLLLNGLKQLTDPSDNWHYAINVVGQFASAGDWGTAEGNDGFFGGNAGAKPTDNAVFLLNQAAGYKLQVTVSTAGDATTVKLGETLQFSAAVTIGGKKHANQDVTWSVSGKQSADTSISESGLLTLGADEYIGGTLTVQALSTADNTTLGTYTITVESPWDTSGVGNITPGTLQTATIDGIDWYVLARDGNKALLLSKDILEERAFDADSQLWQDSDTRTYLNGEWLTNKATLSAHTVETTLQTRTHYWQKQWAQTQDKVFLLSEADVFGTHNGQPADTQDYTFVGIGVLVPDNMRISYYRSAANEWWCRSPRGDQVGVGLVNKNGIAYNYPYYNSLPGVRPAMWINLAQ